MTLSKQPTERSETASPGGSLLIGFEVLKCLSDGSSSLGVTQVADRILQPKTTAHRILQTLRKLGYVEQHVKTKKYRLSPGIFGFLHHLTSTFSPSRRTTEVLRECAARLGVTVHLSMLAGDVAYVVAASGPGGDTQILGSHSPAMQSAAGRALVAQIPEDELLKVTSGLSAPMLEDLLRIREDGIAWDDAGSEVLSAASAVTTANGCSLAVTIFYPVSEASPVSRATVEVQVLRLTKEIKDIFGENHRAVI